MSYRPKSPGNLNGRSVGRGVTNAPESRQWMLHLVASFLCATATAGGILMAGKDDMLAYWQINGGVATPAEFWGVVIVCFAAPFSLLFLCLAFSGGMAALQTNRSPLHRLVLSLCFAAFFLVSAIFSMTHLIRPIDSYPLPINPNAQGFFTALAGGDGDFLQAFWGALFFCISVPLFFTITYVAYTIYKTHFRTPSSSVSNGSSSSSGGKKKSFMENDDFMNDSLLFGSDGSAGDAAMRAASKNAHLEGYGLNSMSKGVTLLFFITLSVSVACCCLGPLWSPSQAFYFPAVSPYSVVGTNPSPTATFQFKVYLDVVVFFGYIWALAFLGIIVQLYAPLRHIARHRLKFGSVPSRFNVVRGASIGEVFVVGSWIGLAIWWWNFWYSQFPYTAINSFNESAQIAARTLGQMASLCFAFLMFPVARNSVWEATFGIPFERAIIYHRGLGYLAFAFTTAHMLVWWVKWAMQGLLANNIFTINNLTVMPPSLVPDVAQQSSVLHSDNFTIPLMEITYVGLLIMILVAHFCRRRNWELFRYVHWFAFVFLVSAIIHAWSFWYYFASGGLLWLVDRCIRLVRGVRDIPSSSVSLEHSLAIGVTKITMPAKILNGIGVGAGGAGIAGQPWKPGAWVYICVPDICAVEWHPFSISSSPLTGEATIHVKDQGEGSWTNRLGLLAQRKQVDSRLPVQIRIDGPYGRLGEDPQRFQNIILVAGGVGITPLHGIFSDLQARCMAGLPVGITRRIHLVWAAQRDALIAAFSETIYGAARQTTFTVNNGRNNSPPLPSTPGSSASSSAKTAQHSNGIRFSFSLHSTQRSRAIAAASSQGADLYRVNIHDKIENLAPFTGTSPDAVHYVMSTISRGRPDLRQNLSMFQNSGSTLVLVCGPKHMVSEVSELCLEYNFIFHSESFEL